MTRYVYGHNRIRRAPEKGTNADALRSTLPRRRLDRARQHYGQRTRPAGNVTKHRRCNPLAARRHRRRIGGQRRRWLVTKRTRGHDVLRDMRAGVTRDVRFCTGCGNPVPAAAAVDLPLPEPAQATEELPGTSPANPARTPTHPAGLRHARRVLGCPRTVCGRASAPAVPWRPPPRRRTGRSALIAAIIIVIMAGGAAAGVLLSRGHHAVPASLRSKRSSGHGTPVAAVLAPGYLTQPGPVADHDARHWPGPDRVQLGRNPLVPSVTALLNDFFRYQQP